MISMKLPGTDFYAILVVFLFLSGGCREEENGDHNLEPGTVRDIDGNVYQTVIIGNQEWMAENLQTTRYNDGRSIEFPGADNKSWESNTSGAYSWYSNDEARYRKIYGALYNWHAVKTGKLCPVGWRVPTDDDWTKTNQHLAVNAGGKLKESGSGHWESSNTAATNETGFTALPGGSRFSGLPGGARENSDGFFYYMGKSGRWWTATEHSSNDAWYRSINSDSGNIYRSKNYKETGFSVRCIRSVN